MLCSWTEAETGGRRPDAGRRKQEWYALPGLFLPLRASLPIAVQNLFKKMVVFLIAPKGRFMSVLGGVV